MKTRRRLARADLSNAADMIPKFIVAWPKTHADQGFMHEYISLVELARDKKQVEQRLSELRTAGEPEPKDDEDEHEENTGEDDDEEVTIEEAERREEEEERRQAERDDDEGEGDSQKDWNEESRQGNSDDGSTTKMESDVNGS